MITVDDFNYVMNMRKAEDFRNQGYPPELALRLAGVDWTPRMGKIQRPLSNMEAVSIFEENDRIRTVAEREVARNRRARKLKKVSLLFQIVLAIVLAVAVAHMWKLI